MEERWTAVKGPPPEEGGGAGRVGEKVDPGGGELNPHPFCFVGGDVEEGRVGGGVGDALTPPYRVRGRL